MPRLRKKFGLNILSGTCSEKGGKAIPTSVENPWGWEDIEEIKYKSTKVPSIPVTRGDYGPVHK